MGGRTMSKCRLPFYLRVSTVAFWFPFTVFFWLRFSWKFSSSISIVEVLFYFEVSIFGEGDKGVRTPTEVEVRTLRLIIVDLPPFHQTILGNFRWI